MARSLAKKCLECATFSSSEAIALHGEVGDNCWDERVCHRRRSHYRHRTENNFQRRRSYRAKKVVQIEIDAPITHSAVLVLYRSRKDAPLHAVAAQIWQGNEIVAEIPAIHCLGMDSKNVSAYLKSILVTLKDKYDINRFEEQILELKPECCPISPCPLHF
jgi:hypothetical protein